MTAHPPCLVCGGSSVSFWAHSTDLEYRTVEGTFSYYLCAACDLVFIDPVPQVPLDLLYPANYYSYTGMTDNFLFRIKGWLARREYSAALKQVRHPELHLLDVGGGWGYELSQARQCDSRTASTTVLDLDPRNESRAAEHGHRYVCASVESYEPDRKFDFILLSNIVEHVLSPRSLFERVHSWLAPGGVVLVRTPSIEGLDARLFRSRNWGGLHCPRHWVLFSRESLCGLAGKTGFEVRSVRYIQAASFWALSIMFELAGAGIIEITSERPGMQHPIFGPLAGMFALFDGIRSAAGLKTSQLSLLLQKAQGQK